MIFKWIHYYSNVKYYISKKYVLVPTFSSIMQHTLKSKHYPIIFTCVTLDSHHLGPSGQQNGSVILVQKLEIKLNLSTCNKFQLSYYFLIK